VTRLRRLAAALHGPLLGLSALTLIASSATLVFVLIVFTGDDGTAARDRPLPPLAPGVVDRGPAPPVWLLRSEATAAWLAAAGGKPETYDRTVDAWQARLEALGWTVVRVGDATLARGLAVDAGDGLRRPVIVAPSAAALDDATWAGLRDTVRAGAGLVATWQLGLHRADGGWRGFEPLETLVGARPLSDADAAVVGTPHYVTLLGGSPVTGALPAGARLEVAPSDAPLLLASPAAVADWTRWSMLPFGGGAQAVRPTAIAQAPFGRGRVVWMDFEPAALVASGVAGDWGAALVARALDWARGAPLAAVAAWPRGVRMAAMLALDAEIHLENAADVATRFRDADTPLTAFVVSHYAEQHPDVVPMLAAAGEVGSHTDDHVPLDGRPLATQIDQLERSRDILAALADAPIVGFRPPEERIDAATPHALVAAGYRWLAGPTDKDRAEPELRVVDARALVVLPRVPRDDYEHVVRTPLPPAETWPAVARDLQQLRRLGGLFLFDFHTQFAATPGIDEAVRHLLGLRVMRDVWCATGSAIAEWWRLRAGTRVDVDRPQTRRLVVRVRSEEAIENLAVLVYPPVDATDVRLLSTSAGALPRLDWPVPNVLRLVVPALRAGEERRIDLAVHGGAAD
jgi:peptidoglycan/xylan/chitin deacetylase (PgdA/CDA1 family)